MVSAVQLDRFVAPLDSSTRLDNDGFLLLPSEHRWLGEEDAGAVPVAELVGRSAGFALLAPGGAGKTKTSRALAGLETQACWLNAGPLTRDRLDQRIREVCETCVAIYLDGLDQAASRDPLFFPWLTDLLTTLPVPNVRWRMVCRSAAWPAKFADAMRELDPEFTEWKLLPLDPVAARSTLENALDSSGFDGTAFLGAIRDAGLGHLSACVGQLISVARFWHTRGELPRRAVDAMAYEVRHLLQEADPYRPVTVPFDRSLRVAQRLGAFVLFGNAQAVVDGPLGDAATLSVGELPSDPEPEGIGASIDPATYRQVVDTALFDAGPQGSLEFRHQRYVEYLAAAYVVERGVLAAQIPGLLGVHANGLLPTARIGVAAWLAALKPELVERLLADNALMFAASAAVTELPSVTSRCAVVAGLLVLPRAAPGWSVECAALVHPDLSSQLIAYVAGQPSSEGLWWVARLATAGRCDAVAPLLVDIACDPIWQTYTRRAAVAALAVVGDDGHKEALRGLLTRLSVEEPDTDTDNEIRAALIDALYPGVLTTDELTQCLRPHRSILLGGYYRALQDVPDRVPGEDLPSFAIWLAEHTPRLSGLKSSGPFAYLYIGTIRRAWYCADDTSVRSALARLACAGVESGYWHSSHAKREDIPWAKGPVDRRHALVIEVASQNANSYNIHVLRLLIREDADWLLGILPDLPAPAAETLATCVAWLLYEPSTHLADRILGLSNDHPAYLATSGFRDSVELDSPSIQIYREDAAAEHARARRRDGYCALIAQKLAALSDSIDDDTPANWWRIPWLLAGDSEGNCHHATGHDLTERPGWACLSTAQRETILATGAQYLAIHDPDPTTWATKTTYLSDTVMPDWSGVHLLGTLLRHDRERFDSLPLEVWERWSHTIIATPIDGGTDAAKPRRHLLDSVPSSARTALVTAAMAHLSDLDAHDHGLSPHLVYEHLVAELVAPIAEQLTTASISSRLAHDLLDLLVEHGPETVVLDLCHRLTAGPDTNLAQRATNHLAKLDPNAAIDALVADPLPAEQLTARVYSLRSSQLDDAHRVSAAGILLDAFPFENDPPLETPSGFNTRHHGHDLRNALLHQLAQDGKTKELMALQDGRPDLDQEALAYHQHTAREQEANLALATIRPRALLDLLRRSDARLIHNDADLQNLLTLHLAELQQHLTTTGAFREIWNGDTPQREDDISDWVKRRLHDRLTHGVVIDREVQVTRVHDGGIGTRIDLTATATTTSHSAAQVITEAKRIDNPQISTAMNNQLINRYLIPAQRRYGIFLIYWYRSTTLPQKWATQALLETELREQACAAQRRGFHITPIILDISRPTT